MLYKIIVAAEMQTDLLVFIWFWLQLSFEQETKAGNWLTSAKQNDCWDLWPWYDWNGEKIQDILYQVDVLQINLVVWSLIDNCDSK